MINVIYVMVIIHLARTVQAHQMEMLIMISVKNVMMIPLMIVYKIVKVSGVEIQL